MYRIYLINSAIMKYLYSTLFFEKEAKTENFYIFNSINWDLLPYKFTYFYSILTFSKLLQVRIDISLSISSIIYDAISLLTTIFIPIIALS